MHKHEHLVQLGQHHKVMKIDAIWKALIHGMRTQNVSKLYMNTVTFIDQKLCTARFKSADRRTDKQTDVILPTIWSRGRKKQHKLQQSLMRPV